MLSHELAFWAVMSSVCIAVVAIGALLLARRGAQEGAAPDGAAGHVVVGRCACAARDRRVLDGRSASGLAEVRRVLGAEGAAAETAIRAVQETGHPLSRVFFSDDGVPYEVTAFPRGGEICVHLHDGRGIRDALRARAPHRAEPDWPIDRLSALSRQGALAVWLRDGAGEPVWSTGAVRFPEGTVSATGLLELLALRGGSGATGEPGAVHRRLEVVHGGSVLPVTVVEVAGEDGTLVGFATDASVAASAERSLTRFVQTMTETFAHLTVGLAIFDRNQTLALFNPALAAMWQQDPAWLARRPKLRDILDRLRTARRIPEMRDYHGWRDRLLGLFDDTERADYEELWNLADGTTMRVLGRPHPHGALAVIFDDVTERMRLERRNRHMDDLINSTLENLNEGLAVFAPDGTLQFVNRAFHEIWDTDPASVTLGMHASDLAGLCSRLAVEVEVWDRMVHYATGEENRRAWTSRLSLGSGRMLAARFAPLPDGSTMALFADVTDSERIAAALRERNEALEAAEQMRSAVLDQISHRLRTPLNTILGFGELLSSPRFGELSEQQGRYVSGILEAAAQLLDTISTVTELASLQIDPLEGEEDAPGVEQVFETTVALLEKRAAEAQVGLEVRLGSPIGLLGGNPVRLRQIIFNLTADAIHRCPALGRVTLSGRREADGTVEIATRETAEPGLLDAAGGPGLLGRAVEINSPTLSLVRRLVAAEGGTIRIAEDADGGAVEILCRFPEPIGAHAIDVLDDRAVVASGG